ncbi:UFM1 specific peptidase 1 isoform X4 [Dermacentor variabilis]|uniref:UFM1 specific peptidase 1 isoform X4 n=1 Tax=Dermacentor variabilis TaxID=34621 RepID=UPI003F5C5133
MARCFDRVSRPRRMATILEDVHEGLGLPLQASRAACVKGKYAYYHYGCDGVDDRGWGCGYRTLQTICSWVVYHKHKTGERARAVPSITEIQAALVRLGDKEAQFSGSRDWIGSTEVFLCLDHFYQVPCRILHASTGGKVANHVDALLKHFEQQGSPVMMGGDSDASSKGILGVCRTSSEKSHLLVLLLTGMAFRETPLPSLVHPPSWKASPITFPHRLTHGFCLFLCNPPLM